MMTSLCLTGQVNAIVNLATENSLLSFKMNLTWIAHPLSHRATKDYGTTDLHCSSELGV